MVKMIIVHIEIIGILSCRCKNDVEDDINDERYAKEEEKTDDVKDDEWRKIEEEEG